MIVKARNAIGIMLVLTAGTYLMSGQLALGQDPNQMEDELAVEAQQPMPEEGMDVAPTPDTEVVEPMPSDNEMGVEPAPNGFEPPRRSGRDGRSRHDRSGLGGRHRPNREATPPTPAPAEAYEAAPPVTEDKQARIQSLLQELNLQAEDLPEYSEEELLTELEQLKTWVKDNPSTMEPSADAPEPAPAESVNEPLPAPEAEPVSEEPLPPVQEKAEPAPTSPEPAPSPQPAPTPSEPTPPSVPEAATPSPEPVVEPSHVPPPSATPPTAPGPETPQPSPSTPPTMNEPAPLPSIHGPHHGPGVSPTTQPSAKWKVPSSMPTTKPSGMPLHRPTTMPASMPSMAGTTSRPAGFAGLPRDERTGKPDLKKTETPWFRLPPEQRPYFFSWNNITLDKACMDFVEMSGLGMIGVTMLEKTAKPLTFESHKIMSFDEALTTFNELLVDMDYWVVRREHYLVIRKLTEWYRHILPERTYDSLESYRAAKVPLWELVSVTMTTKSGSPETLAANAVDMVPLNTARATVVGSTNKIELRGFAYFVERQIAYIQRGEDPSNEKDGREIVTYTLQHASVSDAAQLLRVLIPEADGGAPTSSGQPSAGPRTRGGARTPQPSTPAVSVGISTADQVDINEDERLNRLLIKASPAKHKEIAEYIEKYIDLPVPNTKGEMITLKHADPTRLVEIIRPMLGEQARRTNRPVATPQPQPKNQPPGRPTPQPTNVVNVGTTAVLTPVEHMHAILVKAEPDDMAQIRGYVEMLDVPDEGTHVYLTLQFADAAGIAQILSGAIGGASPVPGSRITVSSSQGFRAIPDTNNPRGLVLIGSPKEIADAKKLIEELDTDSEAGTVEKLVHLKNATPSTLSQIIASRFPNADASGSASSRGGGYRSYGGSSSMKASGFPRLIPDDASRTLLVVCPEPMWKDVDRLITELDEASKILATTKSYRLKYANVQTVAQVLGATMGGSGGGRGSARYYSGSPGTANTSGPNFQFDPQSNVLLVTATDEQHEQAAKLITDLDQPSPADQAELRIIQLEKADADYVANKINELFGSSSGGGFSFSGRSISAGPSKVQVRVVAEPVTNRVLITSSEEDFGKAKDLAEKIDQEYAAKQMIRKTFTLKRADSWEVRTVLSTLFGAEGGSSGGGYRGGGMFRPARSSGSNLPGSVQIAEAGGNLIVMATAEKMKEIEEVINTLDAEPATKNEIRTYKCENASPDGTISMARNLEQLYAQGKSSGRGNYGMGGGGGGASDVKFLGSYGSDLLIVSAPAEKMEEIDKLIQQMLKSAESADLSMVIKQIDIKQAKPEDVAEMVAPVLQSKFQELSAKNGGGRRGGFGYGMSGGPEIVAHKNARKVMVSAPEALMPLAEQLIAEFDQPAQPSTMEIIQLKTAKAEEVALVVEQQINNETSGSARPSFRSNRRSWYSGGGFGGGPSGGSSTSANNLSVTAVEASNAVILRGPEEKLVQAKELIQTLDSTAMADGPIIKVYELKNADLFDVVSMIEEMVGGGSSSSSYDSWGSSSGSRGRGMGGGSSSGVVVKSDYTSNKIIVSAPRDKFPVVEQIIEMKEQFALAALEKQRQATDGGAMGHVVSSQGREGITKAYDVEGPVDEIAEQLDKALVAYIGWMDSPYVKSFPLGKQIIVTGKPEHFKMVEDWLSKLQKNPPRPRVVLSVIRVKPDQASQMAQMVERYAPTRVGTPVEVKTLPSSRKGATPLDKIQEIGWNTPITTQPAGNGEGNEVMPVGAPVHPFVPSNELSEMARELAAMRWAQASVAPATQPAATQTAPAATTSAPADVKTTTAPVPVKISVSTAPAAPAKPAAPIEPVAEQPKPTPPPPPQPRASVPPTPSADSLSAEQEKADMEAQRMAAIQQAGAEAISTQQVQIRFDPEQNVFIMVGPEAQVKELQELMNLISDELANMEEGVKSDIRVFKVEHVDVSVAAAILEQMFNDQATTAAAKNAQAKKEKPGDTAAKGRGKAGGPGEDEGEESAGAKRRREEEERAEKEQQEGNRTLPGGQRIRVFPDTRTRTLIIRAVPEDFAAVAELLLKIDRPPDRPPMDIKIFQLKNLNASEVETAIKTILKIEDSRTRTTGRLGMSNMASGRRGSRGTGAMAADALIDQLEQEMLDLQGAGGGLVGETETAGQGADAKLKLNPAKEITIASDATTNSILCLAPEQGMKLVENLIDKLEEQDIPTQIRTFALKHADAEQVAGEMEKIFTVTSSRSSGSRRSSRTSGGTFGDGTPAARMGAISIAPDARTNTLVIRAREPDMKKVEVIVQELDTETLGRQVKMFAVDQGSATDMARTLSSIFTESGEAAKGPRAVKITGDSSSNTILVMAPPTELAVIGERIKELQALSGTMGVPRQIQLMFAKPSVVAEKLKSIFGTTNSSSGSRGARSRRVNIEGDDNSGMLFVTCTEDVFKQIQDVVQKLDQSTQMDVRIFKLKFAFAKDVKVVFDSMVMQLLQQLRASGGGSGIGDTFASTADERTNSFIVAGTSATFLAVEKVLKEIDISTQATGIAPIVSMFTLTKGNATAVAASINAVYRNQRQPGGQMPPSAVAEPNTNSVYVSGTAEQTASIKASFIDPVEKVAGDQAATEVQDYRIAVKNAKVEEVGNTLVTYFQKRAADLRSAGYASGAPSDRVVTIVPDPAGKVLLVTCNEKNKKVVDTLLETLDRADVAETAREVKVFSMKYADPNYVTLAINNAFVKQGRVSEVEKVTVTPEASTQSVVVSASKENMVRIEEMIGNLDKDTNVAQREIIKLTNARADELAQVLTQTYNASRRRSGATPIAITADVGTNSVIVSASKTDLEDVKTMIADLDKEASSNAQQIRVIPLVHIDATETLRIMTEYLRKPSGKRGSTGSDLMGNVRLQASAAMNALVVSGTEAEIASVEKTVKEMDAAGVTEAIRDVRVFSMKYADPNYVTWAINATFAKQGKVSEIEKVTVTPEVSTQSVVVSASKENMVRIEELIGNLDKDTNVAQREIIKLTNARADELAQVLTQTCNASRKRTGTTPIAITADVGTNSVIVSASKTDLEDVKTMIADLDKEASNNAQQIRVIPLVHIDAADTLKIMTEYLRKPSGKRGSTGSDLMGNVRLQASTAMNALVVSGTEAEIASVEKTVKEMDAAGVTEAVRDVRVFPVKYADPNYVTLAINTAFAKQGKVSEIEKVTVTPEASTQSVVVSASKENMARVEEMIGNLDKDTNVAQREIVKLTNARADELAQVLTQTYNAGRRRTGETPIAITADVGTNSVIVSASKTDLEGVKTMIADLDKEATSNAQQIRVVPLVYIDAAETLKIMMEYLRKPSGKKSSSGSDLIGDIRLQASATMNALVISGSEAEIASVEKTVKEMDQEIVGANNAPKMIEVSHASASQIAATLTRMFTEPAKAKGRTGTTTIPIILADDSTNTLLVRASTVDYNLIEQTAKQLDQEGTGMANMEVIPVTRGTDVRTLATQIERTVNEGQAALASQQPGYRAGRVVVGVDERTPALLVSGSPELFKMVKTKVAELQALKPTGGTTTSIIRLKSTNGAEIKRVLDQIVNQNSSGSQRRR